MTFTEFVLEQIGPRPTFTRGNYSTECKAWDTKYVQLLNGGVDESLPVYHSRRKRMQVEVSNAAE